MTDYVSVLALSSIANIFICNFFLMRTIRREFSFMKMGRCYNFSKILQPRAKTAICCSALSDGIKIRGSGIFGAQKLLFRN